MEVVLNSEIARLVLGYLRDQKLHIVSGKFCKYSPYLSEENELIKKGLLPVSAKNDALVQIVREYCHINSKITKTIETFPFNIREAFAKQNLIGKISYLLKLAKRNLNSNISNTADISNKSDDNNSNNINKKKRRRTQILSDTSTSTIETTQVKDLPGYCSSNIKRRRISSSYCFLQDVQSASSGNSSVDEIVDDDDNVPSNETSTNTTNNVVTNAIQSNIQQQTDSTLQQSSTIYQLNTNIEPPVIINTPKPKSTIIFKTTNTANQINNLALQQTPDAQPSILNTNYQQNGNNTICTSTSSSSSLIDPNFSISKLIIMNPNDPTQTTDTIFNTNTGLSPFATGEQVFIDLGTGQTFPFIMTNDGMNCMFLNRTTTDMETNTFQPVLLTTNNSTLSTTEIDESIKKQELNSLNNKNIIIDKQQVTQSLNSKLIKENLTPDTIINQQSIVRSLSTPRRKSSHVRVLNFSPITKIIEKSNQQIEQQQQILSNQPIIESVQILPQLPTPFLPTFNVSGKHTEEQSVEIQPQSAAIVTQSITIDNECSNSNSTDLTAGEHSNVTVIKRINIDTPRRKTNLRSCKRVLSQSNSEDGAGNIKKNIKTKNNNKKKIIPCKNKISPKKRCLRKRKKQIIKTEENIDKNNIEENEVDPMEAWRQMRLKTKSTNFDQHLREMASKTPTVGHFRNHSKRRKRRKIGGNITRDDDDNQTDINDDNSPHDSTTEQQNESNIKIDNNENKKLDNNDIVTTKQMTIKPESKTLLNFKIKTPIKIDDTTSSNKKQNLKMNKIKKVIMSKKKISEIEKNQEIIIDDENCKNLNTNIIINDVPKNIDNTLMTTTITDQHQQPSTSYVVPSTIIKERAKRTANIAHLLETPFKVDSTLFPITPKFIEPQITDTPAIKLPQLTTFSSLKHLDIRTPAFAITPGSSLTPADKETPKSGCLSSIQTDYSSGGSYYRPDESEDLDKQLDRNLNAEMRKRRLKNYPASENKSDITNIKDTKVIEELEKHTKNDDNNKQSNLAKIETTPEIIVSCPVVLEKVKSFSDDKPNIIPHYKFSDALPELTDESTTSSSSSSSASSVSSKSSSASSSSGSTTDKSCKSKKSLFSVIDSSEDEDWDIQSKEKMNKIVDEENSQLVTNDGEVRFPVRSWITPKKPDDKILITTTPSKKLIATKIPNNSMMSIYDEKSKQKSELEQKRQRIKEQLAEDFKNSNKQQYKKISPTKRTPIKKYDNKNEKLIKNEKIIEETSPEYRYNQIEVLTALNLSARKNTFNEQQQLQNQQQNNSNILPNLDDNATSDLFNNNDENSQCSSSGESLKIRNAALALTTLSMQQKKKLTLPIEPLPMKQSIKKLRGRPKKQQIDNKSDKKIISNKKRIINKQPIKQLTIKLRRETRLSPLLLKECDKNLTNEPAKKYEKIDSINKSNSNEDKTKSNKLEKDNKKLKQDIKEVESSNAIKSKLQKDNSKSKQGINEPQPSTSKCKLSHIVAAPIQSSEIRVEETEKLPTKLVEETELPTKLKTNPLIVSKSEEEMVQVSSATNLSKNNLNRINNESNEKNKIVDFKNKNNDTDVQSTDDFEEEDPYEICELMKSHDFPTKTIIYSGSDDYCPEYIKNQYDFKNSVMLINIDGIPHKLKYTNDIVLFSMEPKLKLNNEPNNDSKKVYNKRIKSIPKKNERNLKIIKSPDSFTHAKEEYPQPQNTSTPNLPKFKISHKNKYTDKPTPQPSTSKESTKSLDNTKNLPCPISERQNTVNRSKTDKILPTDEVSSSVSIAIPAITKTSSKSTAKTTTIADNQENLSKNIRAEDISAVLSHLHGSEEQ